MRLGVVWREIVYTASCQTCYVGKHKAAKDAEVTSLELLANA
jgi:hypothetical protein